LVVLQEYITMHGHLNVKCNSNRLKEFNKSLGKV